MKETIVLGLWDAIKQYRELIPLLTMGIVKIENQFLFQVDGEYKAREDLLKKKKSMLLQKNPDAAMKIECKIKANDIIKLINEL